MRAATLWKGIALTGTTLALVACSVRPEEQEAPAAPAAVSASRPAPAASWDVFAPRYLEDYFRAQPFAAAKAGRHEFDGQMPDWSRAGFDREIARLKAARAEAQGFAEGTLTAAQRLERETLLAAIDGDLFWLDRLGDQYRNPAWYVGRLDPDIYLSTSYAPLEKRMAAFTGYARAIPAIAREIRANLRTPMPKTFVEYGVKGFGGYAEFFRKDVPQVFAAVQDQKLRSDFERATAEAAQAMDELRAWVEAQGKAATDDYAIGAELFAAMLRDTERVEVPLERLDALARADLARNLESLHAACERLTPGKPLAACIARMEANKPAGGMVEGARAQLADLRAFIEKKRIVTIPGSEEAHVAEAPPYNRGNFAYINVPGPYDLGQPSTYFVAPPDPSWNAAEREAYIAGRARLLYVTIHEVWPGHFLQFLHANRNPSKIAALFVGYAYAEGWAHYAEEMMWEMDYGGGDPEQHVGQVLQALLRDVRFVCAIGLHTRGMSLAECDRLFRESAFSDPGNARQQAARGTYDPAYLNYTLGKLMIRKLRADWLAKQPEVPGEDPRARWRAFHDQFLSYGGPPVPVVRRQMLGADAGAPL